MGAMSTIYPGETACSAQVLALADAYRTATLALAPCGKGLGPVRNAPFRLLAIHAIELYLNAYLLDTGMSASCVRGLQHDFAKRTDLAVAAKLALRARTAQHLRSLSVSREYLTTRYDPGVSDASHINRLNASLNEVSQKVTARIRKP